jgi:hypothetical protein
MSDETASKRTLQTGDGALLPEELRAFVDAWLEEAGGRSATRSGFRGAGRGDVGAGG